MMDDVLKRLGTGVGNQVRDVTRVRHGVSYTQHTHTDSPIRILPKNTQSTNAQCMSHGSALHHRTIKRTTIDVTSSSKSSNATWQPLGRVAVAHSNSGGTHLSTASVTTPVGTARRVSTSLDATAWPSDIGNRQSAGVGVAVRHVVRVPTFDGAVHATLP